MNHIIDLHALIQNHRIAYGVDGAGELVVLLRGTRALRIFGAILFPNC